MTSANSWGLWGPEDERGALNRLTPAATLRGMGTVRTGEVMSLAVPLRSGKGPIAAGRQPMQHFMSRDGGDYAAGLKEPGFGYTDDYIVMATHGTTHIDALAHVFRNHQMWNGFSADTVTSRGARRCGIEKVGPIVTRAILADFGPPDGPSLADDYAIMPDELADAVARSGVVPEPGDALLVRTGWYARWSEGKASERQWAGLHPSCAPWIDEQGFVLVAADNIAVEQGPSPDPAEAAPLHVALIRNRGIYLAELFNLEELAKLDRRSFLLIISPLPIQGGVGSPVNPVIVL